MFRPSAFAVLRLITKSNFVGCSTGSATRTATGRICDHYRIFEKQKRSGPLVDHVCKDLIRASLVPESSDET